MMNYEVKAIAGGIKTDVSTADQNVAMLIFRTLALNAAANRVTECYYIENNEIKSYFLA